MKRATWLAVLGTLMTGTSVFAQEWADKMFPDKVHDFGILARGSKTEFEFTFSNLYLEDIHVADVSSSCGCTRVRIDKPTLKTYEKSAVVASINTMAFLGQRGATVTVTIDKPFYAQVQLQTKCYIRSDVVFHPGSVDLGSVDQGTGLQRSVEVGYAGRDDWQVLEVKSANPHLSGKVVETYRADGQVRYKLLVQWAADAPTGFVNDQLVLLTNDQNAKQVPIAVEGRVDSGVTVSPANLFLGVVRPGETVTKQLVVRGKKPFRVLSVSSDGKGFKFDTSGETAPKAVHLIPVTFVAGSDAGKVNHTIRIVTDQGVTSPHLAAYAVVSP